MVNRGIKNITETEQEKALEENIRGLMAPFPCYRIKGSRLTHSHVVDRFVLSPRLSSIDLNSGIDMFARYSTRPLLSEIRSLF